MNPSTFLPLPRAVLQMVGCFWRLRNGKHEKTNPTPVWYKAKEHSRCFGHHGGAGSHVGLEQHCHARRTKRLCARLLALHAGFSTLQSHWTIPNKYYPIAHSALEHCGKGVEECAKRFLWGLDLFQSCSKSFSFFSFPLRSRSEGKSRLYKIKKKVFEEKKKGAKRAVTGLGHILK